MNKYRILFLTFFIAIISTSGLFGAETIEISTTLNKQGIEDYVSSYLNDNPEFCQYLSVSTPRIDDTDEEKRVLRIHFGIQPEDIGVDDPSWNANLSININDGAGYVRSQVMSLNYEATNIGLTDENVYEQVFEHDMLHAGGSSASIKFSDLHSTVGTIPDNIYFYAEVVREFYYHEDVELPVNINNIIESSSTISWENVAPTGSTQIREAEEYEIQWVFFDKDEYINESGNPTISVTRDNAFALKAAANVFVPGPTSYNGLDLFYPEGKLFYRIRPVYYSNNPLVTDEVRTYGAWSNAYYVAIDSDCSSLTGCDKCISSNIADNGNWTYVANYSEEGKHKTVISYFDGSLRNRQSMTYMSDDDDAYTIIGETKYDAEGRAAISVMPTPVPGKVLNYQPDFNKAESEGAAVPFDYTSFDGVASPASLHASTGAAAYYTQRSSSSFTDDMFWERVPSAEGKPYSLTTYTEDNTGRVSSTSAMGGVLGPGEGHENIISYSSPTSTELRRLFGGNVGSVDHYKKYITRDANGQLTVTYTDLAGRTIATCLKGGAPDNVHTIREDEDEIVLNLNDNNNLDYNNREKMVNYTFYCSEPFTYNFTYILNGATLEYTHPEWGTSFSIPASYDLELYILDSENNAIELDILAGLTTTDNKIILNDISGVPEVRLDFSVQLTEGEYTLVKKMRLDIDDDQIDNMVDMVIDDHVSATTGITSYAQELFSDIGVNTESCNYSEEQRCMQAIIDNDLEDDYENDPSTWDDNFYILLESCLEGNLYHDEPYFDIVDEVKESVEAVVASSCDAMLNGMIADVSYNANDPGNSGFLFLNQVSGTYDFWGRVADLVSSSTTTNYICTEAIGSGVLPAGIPVSGDSESTITTWAQQNWQDSYADELVKAHREYHHYLQCLLRTPMMQYDATIPRTVVDWGTASSAGYLDPLADNSSYPDGSDDPFSAFEEDDKNELRDLLISKMGNIEVDNSEFSTLPNPATIWQICTNGEFIDALKDPINDPEGLYTDATDEEVQWSLFRSMYSSLKDEVLYEKFSDCGINPFYIAEDDFPIYMKDPHRTNDDGSPITSDDVQELSDNSALEQFNIENFLISMRESISLWVNQINEECPNNDTDIDAYSDDLLQFFATTWESNPLGILTSEMLVDAWNNGIVYDSGCFGSKTVYEVISEYEAYADIVLTRIEDHCDIVWEEGERDVELEKIAKFCNSRLELIAGATSVGVYDWNGENINIYFNTAYPFPIIPYDEYIDPANDLYICEDGYVPVDMECPFESIVLNESELVITDGAMAYIEMLNQFLRDNPIRTEGLYEFNRNAFPFTDSRYSEFLEYTHMWYSEECNNTSFFFYIDVDRDGCESCDGLLFVDKGMSSDEWQTNQNVDFYCGHYRCMIRDLLRLQSISINDIMEFDLEPEINFINLQVDIKFIVRLNNGTERALTNFGRFNASNLYNPTSSQLLENHRVLTYGSDVNAPVIEGYSMPLVIYDPPIIYVKPIQTNHYDNYSFTFEDAYEQCVEFHEEVAHYQAMAQYAEERNSIASGILQTIEGQWMASTEDFYYSYNNDMYHYTLYYYDNVGNLLMTVPPKGVNFAYSLENGIIGSHVYHSYRTIYKYNSNNQVIFKNNTPYDGIENYWYDINGNLTYSQNEKQRATGQHVYTKYTYNKLNRLISAKETIYTEELDINAVGDDLGTYEGSISNTYDGVYSQFIKSPSSTQIINGQSIVLNNTFHRISYTEFNTYSHYTTDNPNYRYYYSYDEHGNVERLYMYNMILPDDFAEHRLKTLDYEYDLLSGNVNEVWYQKDQDDQFVHRYTYDADNRIVKVETSVDGVIWHKDADYLYYKYGPLARIYLGDQNVQGIDYAYTINGWLKGVNSNTLSPPDDLGADNSPAGFTNTANDAYGFSLNYYNNDYVPAGIGSNFFATPDNTTDFLTNDRHTLSVNDQLYNGNISSMLSAIGVNVGVNMYPQTSAYAYQYDQLNRIRYMDGHNYHTSDGGGNGNILSADYSSSYTYDPNGDILTLTRSLGGVNFDDLRYDYNRNGYDLELLSVDDEAGLDDDNPDVEDFTGSTNFTYDEIGNLTYDSQENMTIEWNRLGKVKEITKDGGATVIKYYYDPMGNRIMTRIHDEASDSYSYDYTVRDASGNIMATYKGRTGGSNPQDMTLQDHVIYGSSRLGTTIQSTPYTREYGNRRYELSNHLGNVLAIVSDRKFLGDNGYSPEIVRTNDYYPFGMQMPGRTHFMEDLANQYRFGFNGMEKDDAVNEGIYTTHYRAYDARLARWWSIDPEQTQFADWSPYNNNLDNPIINADENGNCPWCAVVGAAFEYGTQVYDNYQNGDDGYDAWIGKVDFVDVAVEAGTNLIPGGKLLKGAVLVGGELVKNSVDVTGNGDVNYVNDGSEKMEVGNVLKGTAIDATIGAAADKVNLGGMLKSATDNKAVKSAVSDKVAAYKNLNKANNVIKNGNNRSKALLPSQALENVNQADRALKTKSTLNNFGTGTQASQEIINNTTKETTKEIVE